MKHTGIIKLVIEAVGLHDGMSKGKFSPSESNALVRDQNCELASGMFSYSRAVGMLLFMSGHTHPDGALVVISYSWYMFNPKLSHNLALNILVCNLNQRKDRGLVLNPIYVVCTVDAYPDADFFGMYGHENPTYPACIKIHTWFIITFQYFPVLWISKL